MSKPKKGKTKTTAHAVSVETLFDNALAATHTHDTAAAITALNTVLQREPNHARARHLLGAQYASAGKIDDAVLEMAIALELQPGMHLARFQLGLLLLTSGRLEQAAAVWTPLDALGAEHVLNRFKDGMQLMVQGRFDEAQVSLQGALAANIELPALNHEIEVALQAIAEASEAKPEKPEIPAKPDIPDSPQASKDGHTPDTAEDPDAQHLLVSTYDQSRTLH